MRFQNRTILVTGGAKGIGRATVRRLAAEGARVVLADVDPEAARLTVEAMGSDGARVRFEPVDLADPGSIAAMGRRMAAAESRLHGLVNNCGIIRKSSIAETGDADWEPQMSINLRAPALCAKALLPLLKAGPGHVVNLSSEGAFRPHRDRWVYDATKNGVRSLTRNMAVEFAAYGIRANSVAPGWIVTEMHFGDAENPEERKRELEALELKDAILPRLGRPEEVAAAIAFLLSDDASYITATTLHVDGGRVAY